MFFWQRVLLTFSSPVGCSFCWTFPDSLSAVCVMESSRAPSFSLSCFLLYRFVTLAAAKRKPLAAHTVYLGGGREGGGGERENDCTRTDPFLFIFSYILYSVVCLILILVPNSFSFSDLSVFLSFFCVFGF